MKRILVSDSLARFLADESDLHGLEPELYAEGATPSGDYIGIVPDITRKVGRAELERLPALRIVANYGVGYDNIDVAAARERGILVTNTPGVLTSATAELTWALLLAVVRRIGEGERELRAGKWQGWRPTHMLGTGLDGKTLGIIGPGRIGREVARRAPGFGMNVVYWGRTPNPEFERECSARFLPLQQLLREADAVSLHVALAPDTRELIGSAELALMKPTAVLINTARGPVVDEAALIDALKRRQIRGAGLDVYQHEPLIPPELIELENVVLLPHLGSATEEARLAMWQVAWKNLVCGVTGVPVPNPVY